ncbi:MAG TPA: DUF2723 domain-containing protein [Flavipsychrobacter sp.]|nr:DUF2723 domain-containing protein [Flavipsychrobacter sp.]
MNYRKLNNLAGWLAGGITYIVYLLTMERTVSYWDCGEFLACAYKLEVGHSPGAPFFMIMQRMFGLLAGSHRDKVALFINSESALMGGLTIAFLFWTITHMAKKLIVPKGGEPDNKQTWLILGAGIVGGLAYTFSDTFWFSTVEAEVYATSAFFTAITFWAMLKWENVANEKYADRWILLIAFLIGISVCVHLLNLLTIPSLAMIYYFKRYRVTYLGTFVAFIAGCALLGIVQIGVVQYIPWLASRFDILFTNDFGMPFNTGSITFLLLFFALLIWLLLFAKRRKYYTLHLGVLSVIFIIIGYSSYIVPLIRSRADVPVDMTNPDNANSLLYYVDREQFGAQPILFGPDFNTQPTAIKTAGYIYTQTKRNGKDYYEIAGTKPEYSYDAGSTRFFPRIWDNNSPEHARYYREFLGLGNDESPTAADNLKYFWDWQMNWMWWRYFMWNYAGRQNDVEGYGPSDHKNGNWMSGIKPIDKALGLGDIDAMSDGYRNNEARNQLYFLPFILGILGLVYQFNRNKKDGLIVLILFFFTGAATAIYLNMWPSQPRERDYAFQGCTYAYAMWIGIGVLMVQQWMQKSVKGKLSVYLTVILCLLLVPALMAKEEWNDHDRSRKQLARATAYNTLMSCAPNAILFTDGDNTTYPLWYLQEVEHIRPDVRVIIIELLGSDWYIDQLNYRINDADAVPMIWKKEDYVGDHHNYIRYFNNQQIPQDKYFNLEEICNFMDSNDPQNKAQTNEGEAVNYLPTKKLFIQPLSKEVLVKNGLLKATDSANVSTDMKFTGPKDALLKNDLGILNIIAGVAKQGWKRPIYFDGSLPSGDVFEGLNDYVHLEGLVYRLLPYKYPDHINTNANEPGIVDVDKSYNLFMNTYIWGSADRNDVYIDEKNRMMLIAYRLNGARIANELVNKGRNEDAIRLLDKIMSSITEHSYPYDYVAYYIVNAYYRAGAKDKAKALVMKLTKNSEDDLNWIGTLSESGMESEGREAQNDLALINMLGNSAQAARDTVTASRLSKKLQYLYPKVSSILNNPDKK